jgi:hypothetical protein
MRLLLKIAVLILCLIVIAIPVYVFVHPRFPGSFPRLEWLKPSLHIALVLLYATLGIWAFIDLQTARMRMRRGLLELILADIALIWTIDIFTLMKPDFGELLRPFTTVLAYLLTFLVIWVFVIDSPAKPASEPSD